MKIFFFIVEFEELTMALIPSPVVRRSILEKLSTGQLERETMETGEAGPTSEQ
jgi:hypothetical protein